MRMSTQNCLAPASASPFVADADPHSRRHSLERLEAEITELWGHLTAATARFLALVAEFDRSKAYERHGLVGTAQWLNWQCGIGPVAAREKVRVARALEGLPQTAASFARGEISYSKVRAMKRVASPANEDVMLNVALHGTAAHVEKLVRKYAWTQRRDAARTAHGQHMSRYLSCFYDRPRSARSCARRSTRRATCCESARRASRPTKMFPRKHFRWRSTSAKRARVAPTR